MKIFKLALAAAMLCGTAATAAPVYWDATSGGNDHAYEFISGNYSYSQAKAAAAAMTFDGMQGHLATVTSADENAHVMSVSGGNMTWLGGERDAGTNTFRWIAGDEAGQAFWDNGAVAGVYHNFNPGEPNNAGGAEPAVHTWNNGLWNDHQDSASVFMGFVVEFSDTVAGPNEVPLPASGLLLLGGLGAIALKRRKG